MNQRSVKTTSKRWWDLITKKAKGKKAAATIAKQVPKVKKKDKPVSQGDFEPAYPGADYSKEQIAKMTEKEKKISAKMLLQIHDE